MQALEEAVMGIKRNAARGPTELSTESSFLSQSLVQSARWTFENGVFLEPRCERERGPNAVQNGIRAP